jgi:DnaJ-class molecular chaperone
MKSNGRGDAYAEISIAIPKKLNKKQQQIVKSLSEVGL